ncbi:MAG: 4-hydroxy-tetrahydrodipicolinate reductase [Thermoprotei archaeon]
MGISVCVVGATGRFGRTILSELVDAGVRVAGGVCSESNPLVGRTLREAGLCASDAPLVGSSDILEVASNADVVVFASKPEADVVNVPRVVGVGRRVVVGTTGFSDQQLGSLLNHLSRVPSVLASNFSLGANLLAVFARTLSAFSDHFDFSVVEHHHAAKADAPSGTAKWLAGLLGSGFTVVTDRAVNPRRRGREVEVFSIRGGSVPGTHLVVASGSDEVLRIEHTAFSRRAYARGCVQACFWVADRDKPGVYTMMDVLGLVQGV